MEMRRCWKKYLLLLLYLHLYPLIFISLASALVSSNLASTSSRSSSKFDERIIENDHVASHSHIHIHSHIADIKYVDWAGSGGLLPIQSYQNCLPKESFEGWLRKPLPEDWKDEDHNDNNDFDDINTCTASPSYEYRYATNNGNENENENENKAYAENKAKRKLDPNIHLAPIYIDSHIVCVNKASGALSVPGPRRNPSVANLVHEYIGNEEDDVDSMVVHRLDMDTSGLIVYARSKHALSILHEAFRAKSTRSQTTTTTTTTTVYKKYEALVCGHVQAQEGEIDLPLGRDVLHPPFMKVIVCPDNEYMNDEDVPAHIQEMRKHKGYMKLMSKAPKDSLTLFRKISLEYLDGLPVTRLELIPITGRTHQLRVIMAAMGHPILGDNIYGIYGDGSPNGGFTEDQMSHFPGRASDSLQRQLFGLVQERRRMGNDRARTGGDGFYKGTLCLHAKQLNIFHPITSAPMSFHVDPPF